MSLLTLERVSVQYRSGAGRERAALRDVSLSVRTGELVAVAGPLRSGRTTLLRIAAGVAPPSAGRARFKGVELSRRAMVGAPNGIAYAMTHFEPAVGRSVLEQVAAPMLGRGFSMLRARTAAYGVLCRVGIAGCASFAAVELNRSEAARVAVARALMTAPALLLLDDPPGVPLPTRRGDGDGDGGLFKLLRAIAHHDAIAVIVTTDLGPVPDGVDRACALDRGTLRTLPGPQRALPPRRLHDTA